MDFDSRWQPWPQGLDILTDLVAGLDHVGMSCHVNIQSKRTLVIKAILNIYFGKTIIDGGNIAQQNLGAIITTDQYYIFKISSYVRLRTSL